MSGSVYSTAEIDLPDNLPIPTGYHILVVHPKVNETTAGGLFLPTDIKKAEDIASIVCKVVTIGKDAYPDTDPRFSDGPWCVEGDWVLLSKYTGHRFEYEGAELRIINDDSVMAVISDPTKVSRATA
tara:strand:- start:7209 stop:7589 length:381 start_codon:yes stop_codon:yes gene_type:complete